MTKISLLVLLALTSTAKANLQVFPTRVFLSDTDRVANVSLRHMGKTPMEYKVTAVFYRMTEDGSLAIVDKPTPEERPAMGMIRFSPRRVSLKPGAEQVVRIISTVRGGVAEGEYRAHLRFEPKEAEGATTEEEKARQITMKLKAKVSVAVPVIYTQGSPKYDLALSGLTLETMEKKPAFSLVMTSSGNAFPVGDFKIYFTPKGGTKTQVGLVKGVSSYVKKRTVRYGLDAQGVALKNGTLRAEFYQPNARGGALIQAVEKSL